MGTSKDATAGTGGAWTPLKYAATSFTKGLASGSTGGSGERLIGRSVAVLGGGSGAAATATTGGSAARRLGAFLTNTARNGLDQSLRDAGLDHLIGLSRFEVLDELMTMLAGDGSDDEAQAARDAACDVLDELFGDAADWDDLAAVTLDTTQIRSLLIEFLGAYVYNRIPVIAERLASMLDPTLAAAGDDELRSIIRDVVGAAVPDDPTTIDWAGDEGQAFIDQAIRDIYDMLGGLE